MSTKISQKEYIKKYLSGDKKKKKKDKKHKTKATVKIIDDDVHGNNDLEIDEELLLTGEDAPQIVGIVNASGEQQESKWKSISGIKEEKEIDDDPWGKKADPIIKRVQSPRRRNPPKDIDEFVSRKSRRRNSDQSPPRFKTTKSNNGHNSPSASRSRWNANAADPQDQSPPRKSSLGRSRRDTDQSPPRKLSQVRSRRNSDQSPPRKRSPGRSRRDTDQSPPRKRSPARSRRNGDQSPPRKRSPDHSDQSPPRRRNNSDQSPPRRKPIQSLETRIKRENSSEERRYSNRSPPRRRRDSDQSPPRKNTRIKRENSTDQSPPRRGNTANPFKVPLKIEHSPPHHSQHNRRSESPPPTHKSSASKMSKTLDGKRAGLQDAQTLRTETEERRRNEDRMYSKMSKEVSGRDAEVQVRQSSYRRHRKYVEEDPEVQRQKAEHEEKKKELYSRWNKGVKQVEQIHAKISDDQYEGSKPLARYSNDADLDEMLRQKEREDDPMLEYIRSKKKDQQLAANIPVMPKYKGLCPENRFDILPGYRWDGVDRSNGYEKKWFDVQSAKEAREEEAYLYSVEDL